MSVTRFLAHLHELDPKFICYAAGPDSAKRIEVPVQHALGAPAERSYLKKLRSLLGQHAVEVEELYAKHDGFDLYVQSPEHVGLVWLPISEWESATHRFREELADWGRSLDDAYDFEREGVVFGEPAFSGNHLFLYKGAVYYSDHDGGDDTPLAHSFNELLERIVTDPAQFLYDLGCYARYTDGQTETQWIPERYVSRDRRT